MILECCPQIGHGCTLGESQPLLTPFPLPATAVNVGLYTLFRDNLNKMEEGTHLNLTSIPYLVVVAPRALEEPSVCPLQHQLILPYGNFDLFDMEIIEVYNWICDEAAACLASQSVRLVRKGHCDRQLLYTSQLGVGV